MNTETVGKGVALGIGFWLLVIAVGAGMFMLLRSEQSKVDQQIIRSNQFAEKLEDIRDQRHQAVLKEVAQ
jgi:hypothetical protein